MTNSTIMITGCASGIGRQLGTTLAAAGHRLILTDINEVALLKEQERNGWPRDRVLCQPLDVRDQQRWQEVLDLGERTFGGLDVLMNVAGYLLPGFSHEAPATQVDLHLDINAKGVIFGTQAAAARMVSRGRGHIINIASMAALAPVPGLSLYCASKFAVRGFSLAVAQELRPHGVYVTVVCPDAVQTPMLDLQVGYKEAALTFSGSRALTVQEVERAILGRVLVDRPLEVVLPASRGLLAKLACVAPSLTAWMAPILTRKGLARQAALRNSTD